VTEIPASAADTLFLLIGACMVLAMHAGFAFLEVGTVSTIAYFFIGYQVAYGDNFFGSAAELTEKNGYEMMKFFFLATFAAAIPAIISGGIAERARFGPQLMASLALVAC